MEREKIDIYRKKEKYTNVIFVKSIKTIDGEEYEIYYIILDKRKRKRQYFICKNKIILYSNPESNLENTEKEFRRQYFESNLNKEKVENFIKQQKI